MDEAFAGAAEGASAIPDLIAQPPFDRLPDQPGSVASVELVDGDDAGGGSHVDLGQPLSANDVDAGKQQSALLELGAKGGADFLFASGKLGLRRLTANREVGTNFAFTG